MFNTPILLILWRRPELFLKQLDLLKKVKPLKLYVAIDGFREGKEFAIERELIQKTKSYLSLIDWQVDTRTLIREKNLGCGLGVSEAITWFFDQEEEGIVLEDDVIPDLDFFYFMESQLDKWRDNKSIFSIGASCFNDSFAKLKFDIVYRSRFFRVWGWATYKDRWEKYQYDFKDKTELLNSIHKVKLSNIQNTEWLEKAEWCVNHLDAINTWDYQWQFTIWMNDGYCISPNFWLIDNLGFGENGAGIHTLHDIPKKVQRLSKIRMRKTRIINLFPLQYFLDLFFSKLPFYNRIQSFFE